MMNDDGAKTEWSGKMGELSPFGRRSGSGSVIKSE
jgi:hypothetical protein